MLSFHMFFHHIQQRLITQIFKVKNIFHISQSVVNEVTSTDIGPVPGPPPRTKLQVVWRRSIPGSVAGAFSGPGVGMGGPGPGAWHGSEQWILALEQAWVDTLECRSRISGPGNRLKPGFGPGGKTTKTRLL